MNIFFLLLASWYNHSCLFRLHTLVPSFPSSPSVSTSFWFILQNLFEYPAICHSTQVIFPILSIFVQPLIQWIPGVLSLWLKRPKREADHPPPSISKDKNEWSYTSLPNTQVMEWGSVKAQGNLDLYLVYIRLFYFVPVLFSVPSSCLHF